MRTAILAAAFVFGVLPAHADQTIPHVRLQCSGDEAIVRFEFGEGLAPLPSPLDRQWENVPLAVAEGCKLVNGQTAIVLSGALQTSQYSGGADPPGFFSLWIGGKKVISREFYKGGYGSYGLTHNSVHVALGSLTRCTYPKATENYTDISMVTCTSVPVDMQTLPTDPQAPTPTMISSFRTFSTLSVSSDAFCRNFVRPVSEITDKLRPYVVYSPSGDAPKQFLVAPPRTLFPMSKSGMSADNPFSNTDWNTDDRAGPLLKYQIRHFDLTNSGGQQTILRLWEDSKALSGDIYLFRKDIASQADIDVIINAQPMGEPQIAYRKLAADAGWQVAFAPEEQFSRVYAMPLRIEDVTYLFAYSTRVEASPTATLYRMQPNNTRETICVFQEMRPPY